MLTYKQLIDLCLDDKQLVRVTYDDSTYSYMSTYKWCKNVYTDAFCKSQGIKFEVHNG